MFESISWQEYLSAISLLIAGYYVITTLLLFSSEITTIFKQGKLEFSFPKTNSHQIDSNESSSLIGKVRYETEEQHTQREEKIAVEQLTFVSNKDEEEAIEVFDAIEDNKKKALHSIQEEIQALSQVVSEVDKEECVSLFQSLLSRYPLFYRSDSQEEINLIIHHSLLKNERFQIDTTEIKSWWPPPSSHK
jgi:hypothetical protein